VSARSENPERARSFFHSDSVVIRTEWRVGGVLTTPTTTVVTIDPVSGSAPTYAMTTESTGKLRLQFALYKGGKGYYRWRIEGTGAAEGVVEGAFYVTGEIRAFTVGPGGYD
jgi:hypothetical protein